MSHISCPTRQWSEYRHLKKLTWRTMLPAFNIPTQVSPPYPSLPHSMNVLLQLQSNGMRDIISPWCLLNNCKGTYASVRPYRHTYGNYGIRLQTWARVIVTIGV